MSMEYTKAQAEKILCPVVSRPGEHVNCRTVQCMAWAWSSQRDEAVLLLPIFNDLHKTVNDLALHDGKQWRVDSKFIEEFTDGVNIRWSDNEVQAKRCAYGSHKVVLTRPWDDDRLGGCELCTAKVVDVDVSN